MIPTYWWKHPRSPIGNFGDELSPLVVEHVTGKPVIFSCESGSLFAIGSHLALAQAKSTIWGSGVRSGDDIPRSSDLTIKAIRGPLTRGVLQQRGIPCSDVFGDPAFFLPRLFPDISPRPTVEIGLVPHFNEFESVQHRFHSMEGVTVISVLQHPKQVALEIARCKCVIASSLHALIAADVYDIPSCYAVFAVRRQEEYKREGRDPFKFNDYFLSQGRPWTHPQVILDRLDVRAAAKRSRVVKRSCDPAMLEKVL